ncbi:MAG: NAD(P)H-dependent oxidoreductase [Oscillospiraceae bacterium]|nr:NAD(P)H-dependent oxidoreductase [Oscillospiraceae bacterium]
MCKTLIIYFSASDAHRTEQVAKRMAEAVGADIFSVVPEQPYTRADLNWKNPFSRCNREKFGGKEVPAAGQIENISEYDLILIGFPIWYGGAPIVMQSFLKRHDFIGKHVGVFATSGGSRIGKSAEKLRPCLHDSTVIAGAKLFSPDDPAEVLAGWVKELQP